MGVSRSNGISCQLTMLEDRLERMHGKYVKPRAHCKEPPDEGNKLSCQGFFDEFI